MNIKTIQNWFKIKYAIFFIGISLFIHYSALATNSIIFSPQRALKAHPYLFYTPQRVDRLKQRLSTDTALANSWSKMKARCEQAVAKNKGGDMEELALAYNLTGDNHFADRAKQLLMAELNKDAWDGMDDRVPRWNSGLNTSHTNWKVSVTFDAIYNTLTANERQQMAQRIVKLGIEPSLHDWLSPSTRFQSLNNMGHNWWSAIVFQAGVASLAVMNEVPEAKQWVADVLESSKEYFAFTGSVLENKPATFDPDGGTYESANYTGYAIGEYLLFRLGYTNALGAVNMPYDALLQKTIHWFMHISYPRSTAPLMTLNFGDSNDFITADRPAKILLALGLGQDDYYWYLKESRKKSIYQDFNILTPMGLLYEPEPKTAPVQPNLPPSALYHSMGWGELRSSWQPDATLLGIKCGTTWNHAHADAGSFVLYHKGQYLLVDGGDVNYARPEYSDYFVTSRAHNVLMFNGQAQDPQDEYHAVKQPGHLYNLIDGGYVKYMLADVTGPTSRNFLRNYRNFLWIGDVILIIDDVKTYEAGQFDFLLHYADTAMQKGPDIEVRNQQSRILFRPLFPETLPLGYPHDFPEKMKLSTEYGLKDRAADVKIPYYVIGMPEKTDRTKLVNAIILLDDNNKPLKTMVGSSGANGASAWSNIPVIERVQGVNYIGLRIKQHGLITQVYINLMADGRLMHRNSSIGINGWQTDAYISSLTFKDDGSAPSAKNLESFFMSNGSYLRSADGVMFNSLSKAFIYAQKNGNQLNVKLDGQPLVNAGIGFTGIQKLELNGVSRSAHYRDNLLQITLPQ